MLDVVGGDDVPVVVDADRTWSLLMAVATAA